MSPYDIVRRGHNRQVAFSSDIERILCCLFVDFIQNGHYSGYINDYSGGLLCRQ